MINISSVTIIVPHWSTKEADYALMECLTSLKESSFPMNQVIVSHNGEVCLFGLEDKFPGLRELWMDEQGQCRATNAAAGMVNTEWMMVSNNDMIYPPDWFERLTAGFLPEGDPGLDICISPQLVEPNDGAHTFIKFFCGGVGGDWDKKKFLEYAKIHRGESIRSGFNLPFLLRKETWDLIGGYDINYDPYGSNSDSDLEYKLKLAGVEMWQNTNCPVYHFSQTSGTFHPSKQSFWSKNWDYFIKKWGFPRTDEGIWSADFEIPMDKLIFHPKWEGFYSRGGV